MSQTNNPLSSLSKEQLDALLGVLRGQSQAKPLVASPSQPRPLQDVYYRVIFGCFETIIDGRDAKTEFEACQEAQKSLQPWYLQSTRFPGSSMNEEVVV